MGGERLSKVAGKLQNNALGRFRLETRVNIIGQNQAPVAMSPAIVPVTYTGRALHSAYGIMSTLQVAAHDMDVAVGGQDEVYFVLGSSEQHGAVLANQVPEGAYLPASKARGTNPPTSPWHKDAYEAERQKCIAVACAADGQMEEPDVDGYAQAKGVDVSCNHCPAGGDRWCRQITEPDAVTGQIGNRRLPFSCAQYPAWDNARNLASHPPRMSIDVSTGVITWETGVGPFTVDSAAYADNWDANNDGVLDATNNTVPAPMEPLTPGFYSLVVEIRSASNDPDCVLFHSAAVCADIGKPNAPPMTYVSTTVDFLVYLHPTPAFCSAECKNEVGGIATFNDASGFYGDAISAATEETGAVFRYGGAGSGRCAICGGGETSATLLDRSHCEPQIPDCIGNCPGIFVDNDGNPSGDPTKDVNCNTITTSGGFRTRLVPAVAACVVNRRPVWLTGTPTAIDGGVAVVKGVLGKKVEFDVILEDPDECNELQIEVDGLFKGHMMLALPRTGSGITICSEGETGCGWDMTLGQTTRNGTRSIKRRFTWDAKKASSDADTLADVDPRPRNTEICFTGSDGYLAPVRRCVNIVLQRSDVLYWRDERPQLAASVATVGFNGTTPANGTIFYVSPGNTLEFKLSAKQGIGQGPIVVYVSQGVMPMGGNLTDDNPASGDPQSVTFRWKPTLGQECTHLVCFLARNTPTDGAPIDYAYTVQDTSSAIDAHVDERCFSIVVARSALALTGSAWMDAPPSVPAAISTSCGATVAFWFRAGMGATTSMPLVTLGLVSSGGVLSAPQQLTWHTTTGGHRWALRLSDTSSSDVVESTDTAEVSCTGEWHFVALTVEAGTNNATIYLDGSSESHMTPDTRNFHQAGIAMLTLSMLPGDYPSGSTPLLRFGGFAASVFSGELAGARAYKRMLTPDEVASAMASPPSVDEYGLLAYYGFGDGVQNAMAPGGFNRYAAVATVPNGATGDTTGNGVADSPLMPHATEMSALGKPVRNTASGGAPGAVVCSPSGGACGGTAHFVFATSPDTHACPAAVEPTTIHSDSATEVTVTGSGFSKSAFLACHFSSPEGRHTTQVRATWISETQITCKAPRVPHATVTAVEVANLPTAPSVQQIPLYMLQQVLSVRTTTDTVTLSGICVPVSGAEAFTFSAWVKPESSKEGKVLTMGADKALTVVYAAERFEVRTNAGGVKATVATSAISPPAGTGQAKSGWHFVVATLRTDGAATLAVDFADPIMGNAAFGPEGLAEGSCVVSLGGSTDAASAAQGNGLAAMLEEVTFWTKLLSPCEMYGVAWNTQIASEMCPAGASSATTPTDGLLARFSFDFDVFTGTGPTGTSYSATPTGNARVAFSATPVLPPTFNRPHAASCASSTIGYANGRAFRYTRQRFAVDNTISEPIGLPAKCEEYAPEASPSKLPMDGPGRVTLKGFGFAESQWLQCQGEGGDVLSTKYVSLTGVECILPAAAAPAAAALGITNAAAALPAPCEGIAGQPPRLVAAISTDLASVLPLHMLDPSLSLDGGATVPHVSVPAVAKLVADAYAGVTMGAWFRPDTGTVACAEQPVVCLSRACPESASSAPSEIPPFPLAHLCIMYVNGAVYLLSDSNTTAPGTLFGYSTASIAATSGEWHYASVTVEPSEFDPPLVGTFDPSLHTPRFAATLVVDGVAHSGNKILIAGIPPAEGTFSFGGAHCAGSGASAAVLLATRTPSGCDPSAAGRRRALRGIIDEVRVFRGEPPDLWASGLTASAAASAGAVAYFRMDPPLSEVSRAVETYQPTSSDVRSIVGNVVGSYTVAGAAADAPTYVYAETPWTVASTSADGDMGAIDVGIDGGQLITVLGFNVAPTSAAGCLFHAPTPVGDEALAHSPQFVRATAYSAGSVSCVVPRMGMPGVGSVRAANPGGAALMGPTRTLHVHEMAIDLQGDIVTSTITIGGSANAGSALTLTCPADLRIEAITFAAYGQPLNRCTPADSISCDGNTATTTCAFATFAVNSACDSDVADPISVVAAVCVGKAECAYTPTATVWDGGTSGCTGQLYLSVHATCTDGWASRDFVIANDISTSLSPPTLGGSSYTIMAWVLPRSGSGLRAVAAFGADAPFRNRGIIQWDGASSTFYYYDDYVYDVAMRIDSGAALTADPDRWHHLAVTVASDNAAGLYLNGDKVASFSTSARPAADGTFIIGAALNEAGDPHEFFNGMVDNFFAFSTALTPANVALAVCGDAVLTPEMMMVAHYRFNGKVRYVLFPVHDHGTTYS